jgi:hypothetical protein
MDGSSSEAMVTFFVWGWPSVYLQAPPDHFDGTKPYPVRRALMRRGLVGLVRGPSRGMLHNLAAQRSILSFVVPNTYLARLSYVRQIYVVIDLSSP